MAANTSRNGATDTEFRRQLRRPLPLFAGLGVVLVAVVAVTILRPFSDESTARRCVSVPEGQQIEALGWSPDGSRIVVATEQATLHGDDPFRESLSTITWPDLQWRDAYTADDQFWKVAIGDDNSTLYFAGLHGGEKGIWAVHDGTATLFSTFSEYSEAGLEATSKGLVHATGPIDSIRLTLIKWSGQSEQMPLATPASDWWVSQDTSWVVTGTSRFEVTVTHDGYVVAQHSVGFGITTGLDKSRKNLVVVGGGRVSLVSFSGGSDRSLDLGTDGQTGNHQLSSRDVLAYSEGKDATAVCLASLP